MKKVILVIFVMIFFVLMILVIIGYTFNSDNKTTAFAVAPVLSQKDDLINANEIRVMTYNIRHGVGIDGRLDLERIVEIIRLAQVDIVGLNEVDVQMVRSAMVDQSKYLGQKFGMESVFIPASRYVVGQYGNALLSHIPIRDTTWKELPRFMKREPRSLGIFTVRLGKQNVYILVTHLGLNPVERQEQLVFLTQQVQALEGPIMVLGDFNSTETSYMMLKFLQDTGLRWHSYRPTFPADAPELKLDYILTSEEWEEVEKVEVINSLASDHLPIVGTFRLKPPAF